MTEYTIIPTASKKSNNFFFKKGNHILTRKKYLSRLIKCNNSLTLNDSRSVNTLTTVEKVSELQADNSLTS